MAYFMKPKKSNITLPYLPITKTLKNGCKAKIILYKPEDHAAELYRIFREIVEEGDTYPQETVDTIEEFTAYYTAYETFVCVDSESGQVLGAFYVKPNYPGRSSHYSNGGFIVDKPYRGLGVCQFMGENYLFIARDLGYKASIFNLVYVSNKGSIHIWRKLGFTEIGRLPKVGNLRSHGFVDAIQFYYDLSTVIGTPVST